MEIMCYNTNKLFSGDIPMKMQDYICKVIDSFPRKMLQWDTDIRDPVARRFASRWEDAGGYEAFAAAINNLVEEKVLSPVKKSGLNGLSPPLALRYRKLPLQEGDYSAAKEEILSFYCSRMDLSSFLNSPQDYDRHRDVLMAIDHFLIEAENNPPAVWDTVNERSFALTGHEKFLSSHKGNQLLKRIKITLQDLCCVPAPEPFFFWANALPLLPEERAHCLVVENKDTFHSLKYLLRYCTVVLQQGGNPFYQAPGTKVKKGLHTFLGNTGLVTIYRTAFPCGKQQFIKKLCRHYFHRWNTAVIRFRRKLPRHCCISSSFYSGD
jgi:hypothetical protein